MSQLQQNAAKLEELKEMINALQSVVVYSGTGTPSADLGKDGDIYLVTEG